MKKLGDETRGSILFNLKMKHHKSNWRKSLQLYEVSWKTRYPGVLLWSKMKKRCRKLQLRKIYDKVSMKFRLNVVLLNINKQRINLYGCCWIVHFFGFPSGFLIIDLHCAVVEYLHSTSTGLLKTVGCQRNLIWM